MPSVSKLVASRYRGKTVKLVSEQKIVEALASVLDETNPNNWLLLNYTNKNTVGIKAQGHGGADSWLALLDDDKVFFVIYQFFDQIAGCDVKKLAFITYVGPRVQGLVRASVSAHRSDLTGWVSAMTAIGQEFIGSSVQGLKQEMGRAVATPCGFEVAGGNVITFSAPSASPSPRSSASNSDTGPDLTAPSSAEGTPDIGSPMFRTEPMFSNNSSSASHESPAEDEATLQAERSDLVGALPRMDLSEQALSEKERKEAEEAELDARPIIVHSSPRKPPRTPLSRKRSSSNSSQRKRSDSNSSQTGVTRPRSNSQLSSGGTPRASDRARSNSGVTTARPRSLSAGFMPEPINTAALSPMDTASTSPRAESKSSPRSQESLTAAKKKLPFTTLTEERSKLRSVQLKQKDKLAEAAAAAAAAAEAAAQQEMSLNMPNSPVHALGRGGNDAAGHVDQTDNILAFLARNGTGTASEIGKGSGQPLKETIQCLEQMMRNGLLQVNLDGDMPPLWYLAKAASFPLETIRKKRAALQQAKARAEVEKKKIEEARAQLPPPEPPFFGGCNCQAVRYAIKSLPMTSVFCHCAKCRRATGAPMAFTVLVEQAAVEWTSGKAKEYGAEGEGKRGFCGDCGTHLYHLSPSAPQHVLLVAGSLDMPDVLPLPQCHVQAGSALAHVLANLNPNRPIHSAWPPNTIGEDGEDQEATKAEQDQLLPLLFHA
eukprot:g61254.t1